MKEYRNNKKSNDGLTIVIREKREKIWIYGDLYRQVFLGVIHVENIEIDEDKGILTYSTGKLFFRAVLVYD